MTETFDAETVRWSDSQRHVSTIRLYSAIHVGSRWKIQDRRQIKNRHYKNKRQPRKANNTMYSRTTLAWFRRFIRHSARKRRGIIQSSRAHTHFIMELPVHVYQTNNNLQLWSVSNSADMHIITLWLRDFVREMVYCNSDYTNLTRIALLAHRMHLANAWRIQ